MISSKKEIERLKEELKYTVPVVEHNKTITKHLKEIERLNNIINKLEKYLKEQKEIWVNDVFDEVFDKLQELKGDDKIGNI